MTTVSRSTRHKSETPLLGSPVRPWVVTLWTLAVLLLAAVSYFYVDRPVAGWVAELPARPREIASEITVVGEAYWSLLVLSIVYAACVMRRQWCCAKKALFALAAVALSGLLVVLLKVIVGRYRPGQLKYGNYGFQLFEGFHVKHDYSGFPSGHSATFFALAAVLCLVYPRWRVLWIVLAVLLASTRVFTLSHYLSDVLAGALLGVLVTLALRPLLIRSRLPGFRESV